MLSNTGMVVAYEADDIDPREHVGWSVIVTRLLIPATDPTEIHRYQPLLQPWVAGSETRSCASGPSW